MGQTALFWEVAIDSGLGFEEFCAAVCCAGRHCTSVEAACGCFENRHPVSHCSLGRRRPVQPGHLDRRNPDRETRAHVRLCSHFRVLMFSQSPDVNKTNKQMS